VDSPDVVGVQVVGEQGTLRIINIYNDCEKDDAMDAVDEYMRGRGQARDTKAPLRYIWLGDFNRHSPLWDEERNNHLFTRKNLDAADYFLDIVSRHGMQMTLPQGIPTLKAMATGNLTRVDNVFCDENSVGIFVECGTKPSHRPVKTDHYPVISKIRLTTTRNRFTPRYNFRKAEWEGFVKKLTEELSRLPPPAEIFDVPQAEYRLERLNATIGGVVDEFVPMTKICPHSKRWWTKDLTKTRRIVKQLARASARVRGLQGHPDHKRYKIARNLYAEEIRRAKAEHWATWLAEMDGDSVWTASRLATGPASDGGAARMPTLQVRQAGTGAVIQEARDNGDKANMLHRMFFPPQPEVSSAPGDAEYPAAGWKYAPVTNEQIDRAIRKLKPHKGT
jgi:hypothetical protein